MQARKIKISVGVLTVAGLLLAGCGPNPSVSATEASGLSAGETGQGNQEGDRYPGASGLKCGSSDDCQNGMICVDGECMIPKLAR